MPASPPNPVVSLLTDFGTRDHYAGVMKAVIARLCPAARVIDISHEVEPFQIAQGAYLLSQSWNWFPPGTVHVAVVDPGVGSTRRALAAQSQGHYFVLPDNGMLSLLGIGDVQVREICSKDLMLHPVSRTFHGRDVFAPAGAQLASGFPFHETGPEIADWLRLSVAESTILHIDRFGNVITSLRAGDSGNLPVRVNGTTITRFAANYASVPKGELFLIAGSGGYVEISERESSAAVRLGCRVGDVVTLVPDSTGDRS